MKKYFCLLPFLLAACANQPDKFAPPPQAKMELQSRARVHVELGAGYYGRGQYDVALQELNEAIRIDPDNALAYNMFGLVYMTLRENELAERKFEKALSLSPRDSEINNNYGWFLCQTGHEKQSIKHFLTAIENPLYQTPDMAYVNAGICSYKMADAKNAQAFYEKALSVRKDNPLAMLGLAEISFDAGRLLRARGYLSEYQRYSEPSPKSLWLGVRLERKLGGHDAESSYAAKLKNQFPDSVEARELMDGKFE